MGAIELTGIRQLMNFSSGSPEIAIGLIDGQILVDHPDLTKTTILEISPTYTNCSKDSGNACMHGTFIAGILKSKKDAVTPGICPNCTLLVRSVFFESNLDKTSMPFTTPKELAQAIIDCIAAGARVLNLSLAIARPSLKCERELEDALNYAATKGVIIVAAAGNQGMVGSTAITRHPWVIPVIAANIAGAPLQGSAVCHSIGRNGLSAPGENITSLGLNDNPVQFSGTSVAVPFVVGTIALLWSLYPNLPGAAIKQAISFTNTKRRLVPPLLDAMASYQYLTSHYSQKSVA